ncbi:MAG: hypothetical protein WA400_03185 [Silvibacterium sp.]
MIMTRTTARNLVLATVGCLIVVSAGASTACAHLTTDSSCPAGAKSVSEIPGGQIDGHNTAFTLNADPLPSLPLRVFSNGIEIESPRDYQVTGTSLVFSSTHVPSPGDVINVFYFKQGNATTTNQAQPQQSPPMSSDEKDISNQLLQNAMNREMSRVLQINSAITTSKPPNGDPSARRSQNVLQLSSIDMLERQLKAARSIRWRGSSHNASRRVSADGIEGLGDNDVPSPFDTLSLSGEPALNRLLQGTAATGSRSSAGGATAAVPISLRMLVDRLSSQ